MSEIRLYINQLWDMTVVDLSWLAAQFRLGTALWLAPLVLLAGGILVLTDRGAYYFAVVLSCSAVVFVGVIAPFKVWRAQDTALNARQSRQQNRIPLLDLAKWASETHGWKFEIDSFDGLVLMAGLRQAARDGEVIIEAQGERNYWSEYDRELVPLDPIPKENWSTCEISIPLVNTLMHPNHDVELFCETEHGRRVTHRNLHISAHSAKRWIESSGADWRKKMTDACQRENERSQRRIV